MALIAQARVSMHDKHLAVTAVKTSAKTNSCQLVTTPPGMSYCFYIRSSYRSAYLSSFPCLGVEPQFLGPVQLGNAIDEAYNGAWLYRSLAS